MIEAQSYRLVQIKVKFNTLYILSLSAQKNSAWIVWFFQLKNERRV